MSGPVLILDATPEGPALSSAIRAAGYLVLHARPEDGAALAALRRPALVVLDADQPEALSLCGTLRGSPTSASLPILLVGRAGVTLQSTADAIVRGGDAFFPRPVDSSRLIQKLRTYLGEPPEPLSPMTTSAGSIVSSSIAVGPTLAPREKTFVLPEGGPAAPAPPATEAVPAGPERSDAPAAPPARPSEPAPAPAADLPLSTELRRVLSDVEQRLFPESPPLSFQSLPSEEDLEAFLPPELVDELAPGLGGDDDPSVDTFAGAFETESFQLGRADHSVVVSRVQAAVEAPAAPPVSVTELPPRPVRTEPVPPPSADPPSPVAAPAGDSATPDAPTPSSDAFAMGEAPTGLMVTQAPAFCAPPRVSSIPPPEPGAPARVTIQPPRASSVPPPEIAGAARATIPSPPPRVSSMPPPEVDPTSAAEGTPRPVLRLRGAAATEGELHETDLPTLLAAAWAGRLSGRLQLQQGDAEKVVHLWGGQVALVTSNLLEDRLVEVLWREGRIARPQYEQVRAMIAASGRRAGAILVERGVLRHEELFPIVRHHFEGILFSIFAWERGHWSVEGGALPRSERIVIDLPTPALIVEGLRRKLRPEAMAPKLGGPSTVLRRREVGLCELEAIGLVPEELEALARCDGMRPLSEVLAPGAELDLGAALYGLVVLGHLEVAALDEARPDARVALERQAGPSEVDRSRILERLRLARVADYFSVLGLPRGASGWEIRRAYLDLRRELAAGRAVDPSMADLSDGLAELREMVDEAYEILRDPELRGAYAAHLP
ncbi:MAG: DUF4388 domain-containing protein [Deltaproteobacteria bacterium]|nr:DUF4388 domain-containing protein [Deltaproteobacteria bacterium]